MVIIAVEAGYTGASVSFATGSAIGAATIIKFLSGEAMQGRTVKSTLRTFEILELFKAYRRPMRLNEIYQALNYPQSSATYLLKSMVNMGYINYNREDRTYLPTVRVSSLGNWLPGFIYGENTYQEVVRELQQLTDETVALSSQNDLFIQYIMLQTPSHEHKMPPPQGAMRAMADSSSGLALMSKMSDEAIEKICRYTNYYQILEERVDLQKILDKVSQVRETGFVYMLSGPNMELSSIAMPLEKSIHNVPLSLGVGGYANRIGAARDEIVEHLRSAVMKVARM